MHPLHAITAATREAAELLGLLHETGTLEPGKSADILLVDGDPIEDITRLSDPNRIVGAIAQGRWVKREGSLTF